MVINVSVDRIGCDLWALYSITVVIGGSFNRW